jgi:hypothetical protein
MALVVEDGSGLSTANSYVSEADVDAYILSYVRNSGTWTALNSATKEAYIKEATQSLDLLYGQRFVGYRKDADQALAWPRSAGYDTDGYSIAGNVVPDAVKRASGEMAWRHANDTGPSTTTGDTTGIIPDAAAGTNIMSEKVSVGSVSSSTTYAGAKGYAKSFRKVSLILQKIITPVGAVYRA